MMVDPHDIARGLFEQVEVDGKTLRIPALVPKLSATPGRTDWPGPEVGAFNEEVYGAMLGLAVDEIEDLRQRGIV
jgi:crotonobetainyl-CoA:carnitine CoA-transferase CaiB-like acyl-CoA transferase